MFQSIHFFLLLSLLKQLMVMPLHGMLSPHLSLSVNPKPNQSIWPMESKQLVKHPSQIICCHCWEPHNISVEGMSEWARHLISRVHYTSLTFHIMNVGFEMSCTYSNTNRKCQRTTLRILNDQVVEKTHGSRINTHQVTNRRNIGMSKMPLTYSEEIMPFVVYLAIFAFLRNW